MKLVCRALSARAVWFLSAAVAVVGACASDDLIIPGHSTKSPEAPVAQPRGSATTGVWEHSSLLATLVSVDDRMLPSSGHNPSLWNSRVKMNTTASEPYLIRNPSGSMPTGSVLVEHHEGNEGESAPTYAMVKREPGFDGAYGDWEYLIMSSNGQIQARGSSREMSLCARCHADAPGDHVFGPRSASYKKTPAVIGSGNVLPDEGVAPGEDATPEKSGGKLTPAGPKKKKK